MANTVIAENLKFPEGPAFDRDGNLYVVEIQGDRSRRSRPTAAYPSLQRLAADRTAPTSGRTGSSTSATTAGFRDLTESLAAWNASLPTAA